MPVHTRVNPESEKDHHLDDDKSFRDKVKTLSKYECIVSDN